jgi:hypothetical protein
MGLAIYRLFWFWMNPPQHRRGDRIEDVGLPRAGKEGTVEQLAIIDSGKGAAGSLNVGVA